MNDIKFVSSKPYYLKKWIVSSMDEFVALRRRLVLKYDIFRLNLDPETGIWGQI